MKKFLSLVLALVMTMSLVTISAGATEFKDLTDVDSIEHKEAVELFNKIGIITGYEDGSFGPEKTITREQAAKIIAIMALGNDAASKLGVEKAPFPDVPADSQFAGYIGYCVSAGIIDGYKDGTFKPKGTLTGYQFAKMLLGVIGYGVNDEYVGSNWALNVARDGASIGLFDDATVTAGLIDRDNATQIAFNALKSSLVTYSSLLGTYVAYNLLDQTLLGSLAQNIFGLTTTSKVDGYGYNTHAWRQNGKIITGYYLSDKILGTENTAITYGNLYKNYSWNALTAANGYNTDGVELWVNGTQYWYDTDAEALTDTFNNNCVNINAEMLKNDSDNKIAKGWTFTMVDVTERYQNNGTWVSTGKDGDVEKVIITIPYLAEVTAVKAATASAERTVNLKVYAAKAGATAAFNVTGVESDEFEKGDMILVTPSEDTSDGFQEPLNMVKAETVEGKVTAYYKNAANNNNGSVTVDGVKYNYNWIFANADDIALGDDLGENGYNLNKSLYTFYLDDCGNIIGAKVKDDVINDYAYIVAVGEDAFQQANVVKALLSDGTIGTYTVSSKSNVTIAGNSGVGADDSVTKGDIYAYSINANGEIVLNALTAPYSQEADNFTGTPANNGTVTSFTKGNSVLQYTNVAGQNAVAFVNDATVFIYLVDGKATVYTGKNNAPSIGANGGAAKAASLVINSRTGTPYATFVVITEAADSSLGDNYLFVLNGNVIGYAEDVDGDPVYYYDVVKDGVKTVVAIAGEPNGLVADSVYQYGVEADKFVSDEPNSVESGRYEVSIADAGDDVDAGKFVGVITNDTVISTVDAADEYIVSDSTVISDVSDHNDVIASGAEVATGDTITVVYTESGSLKIAKAIYITAHAAEGTDGDTDAPALTVTVDGTPADFANADKKDTYTGAAAADEVVVTINEIADTSVTIYVAGAGTPVSVTEYEGGADTSTVATYALVNGDIDAGSVVTIVVTAQTEGHRPVSTTYTLVAE